MQRVNNIVYCGYTAKSRWRSVYSCIRQYTQSLVWFAHSSARLLCSLTGSFVWLTHRLVCFAHSPPAYNIARLRLAYFFNTNVKHLPDHVLFFHHIIFHCNNTPARFNFIYINIDLRKKMHVHFYIVSKTEEIQLCRHITRDWEIHRYQLCR